MLRHHGSVLRCQSSRARTILEWRRYRSIPWRIKWIAIVLMAVTLGISITFFVPWLELKLALAVFGVLLAVSLYNIPSRDRPHR